MNGTTRIYNAANQMTHDGTNTLTYDNNGNLTAVGANSYTWDRANRLLSHGGISYAYDGAGNRISQDTLKYLLDVQPGLTVVLGDSDGNHFVHGIRGIHAQEDNLGNWEYMAQDGLGSVRGLVDDVAVVQSSMSYDPYGNPMGSYGTGYLYAGEQIDDTGLSYNRARYYSPDFGTWLSLDPLETPNRYAYVSGNPVMHTDPSGLFDWCTGEIHEGDTLGTLYSVLVYQTGDYFGTNDYQRWHNVMTRLGQSLGKVNHPLYGQHHYDYHIRQFSTDRLDPNWPPIPLDADIRALAEIALGGSCSPIPDIPCPPDTLRQTIKDWPPVGNLPTTPREQCSPLASERTWNKDPYFDCCVSACSYWETGDVECLRECVGLNDPVDQCSVRGLTNFDAQTFGVSFGAASYGVLGAGAGLAVVTNCEGRFALFSMIEGGAGAKAEGKFGALFQSEASIDELQGASVAAGFMIFTMSLSTDGKCNTSRQFSGGAGANISASRMDYLGEITDLPATLSSYGIDVDTTSSIINTLSQVCSF